MEGITIKCEPVDSMDEQIYIPSSANCMPSGVGNFRDSIELFKNSDPMAQLIRVEDIPEVHHTETVFTSIDHKLTASTSDNTDKITMRSTGFMVIEQETILNVQVTKPDGKSEDVQVAYVGPVPVMVYKLDQGAPAEFGELTQAGIPEPELSMAIPEPELRMAIPEPELRMAVPEPELRMAIPESELRMEIPESELRMEIPESELRMDISESELRMDTSNTDDSSAACLRTDSNSLEKKIIEQQCRQCQRTAEMFRNIKILDRIKDHQLVTRTDDKPYMCALCGLVTIDKKQMEAHMRDHKMGGPYICSLCDHTVPERQQMLDHLKTHAMDKKASKELANNLEPMAQKSYVSEVHPTENNFMSLQNQKVATNNPNKGEKLVANQSTGNLVMGQKTLTNQVIKQGRESEAVADVGSAVKFGEWTCVAQPQNTTLLITDSNCLTEEIEEYLCEECEKRANMSKKGVPSRRTDRRQFKCTECGHVTISKTQMVAHMKKHISNIPYSCSVCGYKTTKKATLIQHLDIHTVDMTEGPFSCSACGYKSTKKQEMFNHLNTHSMEGPNKDHTYVSCSSNATQFQNKNFRRSKYIRKKYLAAPTEHCKRGTKGNIL